MRTITVGQALRYNVERILRDAGIPIVAQGYSNSSTTSWSFKVRSKKTKKALQNLVWNSGISWCSVK